MFHEKWILSRLKYLWDLVTKSMNNYTFSEAGQELQTFTKNEFCDYYIEEFKLTKEESRFWKEVIIYVINNLLKFWHPYIPFITEELYKKLWFEWSLININWPYIKIERNEKIEKDNKLIISLIKEIRKLRAENNIMPNKTIKLSIYAKNKNADIIWEVLELIGLIVKSNETKIVTTKITDPNVAYSIIKAWVEVYVDTENAINVEKEILRLKEQIKDTKEYITIIDTKLLNDNFITKAPKKLVIAEMEKAKQAKEKLVKLEDKISKLSF
jgi:valyl-tRNA synthetase